jgi:saccharopine dehydrogenase-like NADP-dependent oxidoreductase
MVSAWLVKRPGSSFLDEAEETILQSELTGILEITVDGERNGGKVSHIISYNYSDGTDKELQRQLFNTYGTTRVYVSQPALVGAKMCLNGDVDHGVISADSLQPKKFFEGMAERGIPFVIEEKIIKQTSFS